jgi:hypothetical protein
MAGAVKSHSCRADTPALNISTVTLWRKMTQFGLSA